MAQGNVQRNPLAKDPPDLVGDMKAWLATLTKGSPVIPLPEGKRAMML